MVVRAEAPAAVIRLRPRVAPGPRCLRLLPAREYAAGRGGSAANDAVRQDAPGSLVDGVDDVVFSSAGEEAWPGMQGGNARKP